MSTFAVKAEIKTHHIYFKTFGNSALNSRISAVQRIEPNLIDPGFNLRENRFF